MRAVPTRARIRDTRNQTEANKCLRTNLQNIIPVSPKKSNSYACKSPLQFKRITRSSPFDGRKSEKEKRIMEWIMNQPMVNEDSGFVTEYMDDSHFFNDELSETTVSDRGTVVPGEENHAMVKKQEYSPIQNGGDETKISSKQWDGGRSKDKVERNEDYAKDKVERNEDYVKDKVERNEDYAKDKVERNEDYAKDKVERNEDYVKDKVERSEDHTKDKVERNEDHTKDKVERNEDRPKVNLKRMSSNEVVGCSSHKYKHVDISNDYLDLLEPSPGYMRQMALEALDWYDKRMGIGKECRIQKIDIIGSLWDKAMFGVVKMIFNKLPLKHLRSVSLVCRRWNCIFNEVTLNERRNRLPGLLSKQNKAIRNKENAINAKAHGSLHQFQRPKSILVERQLNEEVNRNDKMTDRKMDEFDKSPERVMGRKYTHNPCPMCRRSALVDLSYHKGRCLYSKCRFVFCSVCKAKYHPFMSCLHSEETPDSGENEQPKQVSCCCATSEQ